MYSPEWGTYVVDCGEGAVWSSYSAAGISNIQKDCAILLLFDDVVFKDLVVQGLRRFYCRRHFEYIWVMSSTTNSI